MRYEEGKTQDKQTRAASSRRRAADVGGERWKRLRCVGREWERAPATFSDLCCVCGRRQTEAWRDEARWNTALKEWGAGEARVSWYRDCKEKYTKYISSSAGTAARRFNKSIQRRRQRAGTVRQAGAAACKIPHSCGMSAQHGRVEVVF